MKKHKKANFTYNIIAIDGKILTSYFFDVIISIEIAIQTNSAFVVVLHRA